MRIESIRIQNFKALKDVEVRHLPGMCVFLGANGSGKITLLDVFGFLSDCIAGDVRSALGRRGGFREVVSRGATDPISLTLQFRPRASDTAVVYSVAVGLRDGTPIVEYERLRSGRDERMLMDFRLGEGTAVTNERALRDGEAEQRVFQRLDTPYTLAIKGLGQFDRFPTAAALRRLMESLHRVDAHVDAGDSVTQRGETLADAARRIHEHDPAAFGRILQKMQERVPGITRIEAATTIDGRLVLGFQDEAFTDPFMDHTVSDGTIKMFAYLLLLHDPEPHPLLAIEEPENQLHPDLLMELAEEFREYAERGGQVFISTHSPDFVNGVRLDELFWLTKEQGFTKITRAGDDAQLMRPGAGGRSAGSPVEAAPLLWSGTTMSTLVGHLSRWAVFVPRSRAALTPSPSPRGEGSAGGATYRQCRCTGKRPTSSHWRNRVCAVPAIGRLVRVLRRHRVGAGRVRPAHHGLTPVASM